MIIEFRLDKLTKEQQMDVETIRQFVDGYLYDAAETFSKAHPELRLTWYFSLDASIRPNGDTGQAE